MSYKQKKFDELEHDKADSQSEDQAAKPTEVPSVGPIEVFKYADKLDKFLIVIGVIAAIGCGVAFPFMFFLFGDISQIFTDYQAGGFGLTDKDREDRLWEGVVDFVWRLSLLGGALWVLHYIFVTCLNYAAERQVLRMRKQFFESVMKQEVGWYDVNTTTDFASRMSEDLNKIQDGLGEKIGMFLRFFFTFIVAFIISFYQNWVLSLVLCAIVPLIIIIGVIFGKIITSYSKNELNVYAKAGTMAEEALSSIRTVIAFGGEEKEVAQYNLELNVARKNAIFKGVFVAFVMGLMFGLMYGIYGLGFWYGVKQVMDQKETTEFDECSENCILSSQGNPSGIMDCVNACFDFNPGTIATALFGILQGGMQIGQSSMFAEAFNTARAAAGGIFKVIDRKSLIDSSSYEGIHPDRIKGDIEFKNVFFNYPSRPNVSILQGANFSVPKGKSIALVGSSGCGKSTCIQLIQRFYDPMSGDILLDGKNIKDINVKWLRENIGIVGQEPVLFDCSIRENILYGKPDASEEEILNACREANAAGFISKLPMNLDTMVGEGGTQLSGGQKQRIAIARALIRNPKILLLDEATSALDNESEKIVQTALDKVQSGRTTIIVAHRLTTVRHADCIIAFDKGQVKEQGTHEELMKLQGLYYSLVMRQLTGMDQESGGLAIEHENGKLSKQLSIQSDEFETVEEQILKPKMKKKYGNWTLFKKLLKLNSPELPYIIVGVICSTGFGLVNIAFAILFGDVFTVFVEEPDEGRKRAQIIALEYGGVALFTLLVLLGQGVMFTIAGERLTQRVRILMFKAMLSQEVGWFDLEENNSGALCSRLSTTAQSVSSATGNKIGQIFQSISALAAGFGMSMYYNWKVGLVGNAFVPVLVIGMLYQMLLFTKNGAVQKTALEKSAKLAIDAIKNVRTVAGLGCERTFQDLYNKELVRPHKKALRQSHYRGFVFGFANSAFCFAYATCFAYGTTVYMKEYKPDDGKITEIWKIAIGVLSGAMMVGMSFSFVMDFPQAFVAADSIFQLLERKPKIDANKATGLLLPQINGNIEIQDAEFHYPARPNVQVLKRLALSIKHGEKIALVGQSGCGKSTVIQLIQRLYDLDSGNVIVEKQDIRQLNLPMVRSKIGIVSQEPVLFNRSIAANIMYGDNSRTVTMEEVITAARSANIHNFVTSLPAGNPEILLLDEATSALDTESEKIVQDALDLAQQGRTSISIAHRLSTIVGVDTIYVVERGHVAECGSHEELLKRRGIYFNLWNSNVAS